MKIKFIDYTNDWFLVFEVNGVRIVTMQPAYLFSNGQEYIAHADECSRDNSDYIVSWDVKPEYINMIDEVTDESILCDWENPTSIVKIK